MTCGAVLKDGIFQFRTSVDSFWATIGEFWIIGYLLFLFLKVRGKKVSCRDLLAVLDTFFSYNRVCFYRLLYIDKFYPYRFLFLCPMK